MTVPSGTPPKGLPRHADIDARAVLTRYRRNAILADALCAGAAALLAIMLRFDREAPGLWAWIPIVLPVIWIGIAGLDRVYERRFLGAGTEEFQRVLRSGVVLFAMIAVTSYLSRTNVSRSVVVFAVPVTVVGALAARKLLRVRLHHARAAGIGLERTIVLGDAEGARELVHLLRHNSHRGMVPVGICLASSPVTPSDMDGVPVMGGPEDVIEAVEATQAHVVAVVSHPDLWGHPLRELAWALEDLDVELIVSPGIVEVAGPRLSIRPLAGLSLLHLEQPTATGGDLLLKAAFDRMLGTAILLTLSPLLIGLAIAVRVTSPGPALFRQTRVGVGGREFSIYKFRSMVTDAEHRLIDLTTHDEGNGVLFKMRTDPRVTPLGAFLRRYSLDELPQLINVAKGDMSLVGPRPPLPREVAGYSGDAVRRLRVRPGMTGLWQVSGRSDLSWEQSLLLDLRYVDNWSMTLDLSILWRTVRAVVKGDGAY
ncbi:sugar transferase [Kineosporia sp. NBRC 101731]|uniref:sugar transferase n=1 Tax=Kineosporia sp. NBRC 101731 TaxID=3032199 RepID=UPI0024A0EE36|nr:sugar transferase [Kineosporia sp. NBRC 101731]GLY30040.1 exopolysaccharide biosynthesis polyprenyl glycosylphosphotransferase [Kineosporia sp. NBRC 101731]